MPNPPTEPAPQGEPRPPSALMDFLIRAGVIVALAVLCFQILSPFLKLIIWSVILAVTLYPLHQRIARRIGGKQGLASVILVILGGLLIVVPTALLLNSFADSVRQFVTSVQEGTLVIPPPREGLKTVPVIGKSVYDNWSEAQTNLPAFVQTMQPKIGELARDALAMVASIGRVILIFLASFIVAGIVMAYGNSGARSAHAFARRLAGPERGDFLARLSTATIRAVALGVVGVAAIQAILIGLALLLARVPAAGVLAIIALVLGIAQVPAVIVTLPAIAYIWMSGDYSTGAAVMHTIILVIAGLADNVLKPLMLGRGVDVPMPVILLGALGGMAGGGIVGMFVGATVLALGYEIFQKWVGEAPEAEADLAVDNTA